MLLAAAWKLAMADYRDGSFFEFTLLADERFAYLSQLVGGASLESLADNRMLVDLVREGHLRGADVGSVVFSGSPAVVLVAKAMTWWTVAIECAIGVLFLAPDQPLRARWRNRLLLLFAVSTYVVAPIRGFGWILMLLGLAQCGERERVFRPFYLAAIVLIQAYTLPLAEIVRHVVQR